MWRTLIIAHQDNSQVKDCKINLLTQQYEKFSISSEETIDSGFTRFNAIVTSLKSLDQDCSSKNHVRNDRQEESDEEIDEEEVEAFNLIARNFRKGQKMAPEELAPNALGDAPIRHQRAGGLSKIEVSFNDFAKPVGPQTRFANNRGTQAPITRVITTKQGYHPVLRNELGYTQTRVDQ
nr:UBN2 domain-containing protein [Tanacetum cinerariifolium]